MNVLDIVIAAILVIAGIMGYRKGVIRQVCGIGGLILGIWLGYRFSTLLAGWFGMNAEYASLLCFIIILIAAIIVLYLVGLLFSKVFRMTGFGLIDNLGGLALGVVKTGLLLSLLLGLFTGYNDRAKLIAPEVFDESALYEPMQKAAGIVFPWIKENGKRIMENEKNTIIGKFQTSSKNHFQFSI